ncbi:MULTISPECIES: helix-turn-helix domain-containing protein [unclassified Pseudomonas]|uniref:helix-turn-helix domain-containing protein n=1 Tax=unclassified Pseudomonas TaxID=196821 RepID=UPI00143D3258|nr:helix-turn-helix transcriptional regulator [Pseudomonas sp. 1239]
MSSRNGLAVVLRTLRAIKGVAQSDLPVDRKHLYKLESGLTDVSIKTLSALANSLGMMPATLLMLAAVVEQGVSVQDALDRVGAELDEFKQLGGDAEMARQRNGGAVSAREAARADRAAKIQACKAKGLSQRETAVALGLAKSTVARAW